MPGFARCRFAALGNEMPSEVRHCVAGRRRVRPCALGRRRVRPGNAIQGFPFASEGSGGNYQSGASSGSAGSRTAWLVLVWHGPASYASALLSVVARRDARRRPWPSDGLGPSSFHTCRCRIGIGRNRSGSRGWPPMRSCVSLATSEASPWSSASMTCCSSPGSRGRPWAASIFIALRSASSQSRMT